MTHCIRRLTLVLGFGISISAHAEQGFFCEKTVPSAWYFVTATSSRLVPGPWWWPNGEILNPRKLPLERIEARVFTAFSGEGQTALGARQALRAECLGSGLVALTETAARAVVDSMRFRSDDQVQDLGTRENVLRQTCTALSRRARCESYRIEE